LGKLVVELLGSGEIRRLASELDLRPTKKLGQNFVIDPNTIRKIVAAAGLSPKDKVVEIGPGLGSLTLGLLEKVNQLAVVEFDTRLADRLKQTLDQRASGHSCHIISADAMNVTALPFEPDALVANLPYNISVPVLLHFMETFPSLRKGLVLVQAEVAARLLAYPGSKSYGSPSAKLAWYAKATPGGVVSRNIFWPVPNVDSALVYFQKREDAFPSNLRQEVFRVIDGAFAQRRKTLRQALADWAGSPAEAERLLTAAGISPQARGEDLVIDDFVRLATKK
jgi:16S rRNA (adenine1518-N6/adenine1519-N6)-dimethyltransferase